MKRILLMFTFLLAAAMIGSGGLAMAAEGYTHSSGAFSMIEYGQLVEEIDQGALFAADDGSQVMVLFGPAAVEVSEETVPMIVDPLLNAINSFESYELYPDDITSLDNGYAISFTHQPAGDHGLGEIFVTQSDGLLYVMIMLAADYDAVAEAWAETALSFTPGAYTFEEEVTGEAAPAEEEAPAEAVESEAAMPAEDILAAFDGLVASGFTPEANGFSFENYGDEIPATNLTPAEVQRMFGDQACAGIVDGQCLLTPPAQQWMEQINSYMSGGHCEGMAVLSALMYYGQVDPAQFGGSTASELSIENQELQREIAYWFTTQGTYPGNAIRVAESPSAVLDTLIEYFDEGPNESEWWAMGFYRRDGSAGHAVTPIGVEDMGGGIYHILIYDNNFPGEVRFVEVDRNANTWWYEGSPNPEIESFLYDGDASVGNLEIVAITPRLEVQQCDFCAGGGAEASLPSRGFKQAAPGQQESGSIWYDVQGRWDLLVNGAAPAGTYEIWLEGDTHLLIEDFWGRRIGFVGEELVNEIPGASTQSFRVIAKTTKEPVYRLPVGLSFTINIDAGMLEEAGFSGVSMIGPGYNMVVDDIWMEPGDVEAIGVHIDKSRQQLTYMTDYTESPDVMMGLETDEADYAFIVRATELTGAEDTFDVVLDLATNEFILNTSYNEQPSTYEIWVLRIDDQGERVFGASDVVMDPENTAYIPFTAWEGEGTGLTVDFDYENDGEIDDVYELPDITAEVDFYGDEE